MLAILKLPNFRRLQRGTGSFNYLPVWLILTIGVVLSGSLAGTVYRWEQAENQEQYAQRADAIAYSLQRNLDDATQVARAVAGLYNASERVTQEEFGRFSQQILKDSPKLLSIGFAQRITARDRLTYERQQGRAIWELAQPREGKVSEAVPAGDRAEYYPTTYIEPLNKQKAFLGYDVAAQWQDQIAIARARDTGTMSATERISLETDSNPGFVLYSPVYRSQQPLDTAQQRSQAFIGVTYTTFPIGDIVRASLKGLDIDNLNFYLYKMSVDRLESALGKGLDSPRDRLLLAYHSSQGKFVKSEGEIVLPRSCLNRAIALDCLRTVNLQGREWSLAIVPTAEFAEPYWRTRSIFAIGLLSTGILALYLGMSQRRNTQQKRLLKALTASDLHLRQQKDELQNALHQLKKAQLELVHSEKMSSLGQLAAGIAHEINNPVNFISGNINYALQYSQDILGLVELYQQYYPQPAPAIVEEVEAIELDYIREDFPKILQSMEVGTERIQTIVAAMRNFARKNEAEKKPVDLHQGVESTLMILQHRLKAQQERGEIEVIREYGDLPLVECNAGQINQVFMNLIGNAIDALEEAYMTGDKSESPKIWIRTQFKGCDRVLVEIADNGFGIPPECQKSLFDPFFTTKSVGKGTGLGLSISYQIITEFHRGELQCGCRPEGGAVFQIQLPAIASLSVSRTKEARRE
ncbi:MAG: CHASE domain-containing protein [Cyanobacteriota bacterium]|nr:CHASE domain-containing protein [Cyanobacteriota bacterium]